MNMPYEHPPMWGFPAYLCAVSRVSRVFRPNETGYRRSAKTHKKAPAGTNGKGRLET